MSQANQNAQSSENLTVKDAAKLLGVTRSFLDKDRFESGQNGTSPKIPYVKIGFRTVRYRRCDLNAFLDAQRVS